jgi:hypothetical protein
MCEAGNLFSTFNDFSIRMDRLRKMCESAELLAAEGATAEAQSKAYDDVEDAFFRESAFDDYSDSDVEEQMRRTTDFNDGLVHNGNKKVSMNLFYMCAKRDQTSYDIDCKCGIYMSGKLWDRRGAAPEHTRAWYCGLEQTEWDSIVQSTYLVEAGRPATSEPSTWKTRLTRPNRMLGASAGLGPFRKGPAWCWK